MKPAMIWIPVAAVLVTLSLFTNIYADEVSHHHTEPAPVIRTVETYEVPPVTLLDQNRNRMRLDQALANPRPALVEFFFTTCTTFCDIRAVRLAALQQELAQHDIDIAFYSISVDPEFDRPERLHAYATRIQPSPDNWWLLTGAVSDIKRVESSFHALNPSSDKMLHQPLTFIQARPGQPWIRFEGMMSGHDLAEQVKAAIATGTP